MSISEQVKELRAYSNSSLYAREGKARELLKEAADTIESLFAKLQAENMERSAEDCGGWIPCKERLPENDMCVLAQVNGKYKNITFEDAFEFATYIKGEGWTLEEYPDYYNPNVIAWRKLPEPYHKP